MGLLSGIGNFVGGVVGGLFGGGGSSAGNAVGSTVGNIVQGGINSKQAYDYQVKLDKQNYQYNKELQKYAYNLNQQGVTNAPSLLRQGYEKAGLNPMLAYSNTNAPSIGSTGFSSSPGGSIATQAQANAVAQRQAKANIDYTNAQALLSEEQAKTEMYKRDNFEADSLLKYLQSIKTDKESSWIDRERAAQIEAMIMGAKAQQVASNASMINARTQEELQRYEKDLFKREAEWRKQHPIQARKQVGAGLWMKSIGGLSRVVKPR